MSVVSSQKSGSLVLTHVIVEIDLHVMDLEGDADLRCFREFEGSLDKIMAAGHRNLVLDLRKLISIDCSGLSVLIRFKKKLAKFGGNMTLILSSPRIRKIFSITGLDNFFRIFDSLEGAAGNLAKPAPQCFDCALFCGIPNCPLIKSLAYAAQPCSSASRLAWLAARKAKGAEG